MGKAYVWLSFLCLIESYAQSYGQDPGSETLKFSCLLGAETVHMKFFTEETGFSGAKEVCKVINARLLNFNMYRTLKTCIDENLKSLNPAGVWTDDNHPFVMVFNMTDSIEWPRSIGRNSYICATQDATFKSFNFTVHDNSSQVTNVDLLSSACGFERVLRVIKGHTVTLECEMMGIPIPDVLLAQDRNKKIHAIKSNRFKETLEIPLNAIGTGSTFTCGDDHRNLSISILIKIICNQTELRDCLADILSYTTIKMVKTEPCEPPLGTLTSNDTDDVLVNSSYLDKGGSDIGDKSGRESTQASSTESVNSVGGMNTNQLDTTSSDNHLDVTIPVALATGAVVAAVCSLFYVVCGVFVYRKRRGNRLRMPRPHVCTRRAQLQDDDEVYSKVDIVDAPSVSPQIGSSGRENIARDTPYNLKLDRDTPHSYKLDRDTPHRCKRDRNTPHSNKFDREYPHSYKLDMEYPHSYKLDREYPHSYKLDSEYPHSYKLDREYLNSYNFDRDTPHSYNLYRDTPLGYNFVSDSPRSHTIGRNRGTSLGYVEYAGYGPSVGYSNLNGLVCLGGHERSHEDVSCSGCNHSNHTRYSFQTVDSDGLPSDGLLWCSSICGDDEHIPDSCV